MPYLWQNDGWPHLIYDESAFHSEFERVLSKAGELAGMQTGLSDEERFTATINQLSEETVNSFAIEGENLDQQAIRASLTASLTARDQTRAAGSYRRIADVMIDARDVITPMTVERLNNWHRLLFQNNHFLDDIGQLRTSTDPMQVVTTKRGEVTEVHYETPPSSQLPQTMSALMEWIQQTGPKGTQAHSLQTPGRAALAHLKFETIHPYSDGNGRIGRALADYVAAQNPILARAPFSMSRVIQSDKTSYYNALQTAQFYEPHAAQNALDVTPFVSWFTETMNQAIDQSAEWAHHINRRNRYFEKFSGQLNARQEKALKELFERGPERLDQGLSSRRYRRTTDASRQTATRDLTDLVKKGALRPPTGAGPSTSYAVNLPLEK